jgi:hypothetical protein
MKTLTTIVSLAAGALLATASLAQAPAGATAVCKDGTYWTGASKSGACSGHKGVQTWYGTTAAAAPAVAPAKAAPAAPAATPAKTAPAAASYGGAAPAGATAVCKDGTYWTGASKSGACSGHKGVQTWYGTTAAAAPAAAPAKAAPVAPAAPAAKAAPTAMASGPAPAGATGLCKDGTYWTGASKSGACSGHQGVQAWYGAAAAAAAPAATAPPVAAPVRQAPPAPTYAPAPSYAPAPGTVPSAAPAPGGGAGLVWLNPSSKTYHCPGDKWYGKTKSGQYVTEQQAVASGYHPDHGKACSR